MKSKKKPVKKAVVKKQSTAIARVEQPKPKSLVRQLNDPEAVLAFGKILREYIVKNNLSVQIGDSQYAKVTAWQFSGNSFGLTAIPSRPKERHEKGQYITVLYSVKEFTRKDKVKYNKEVPVFIGFSDDSFTIDTVRAQHDISREITRPFFSYECETVVKRMADDGIVSYGMGICTNMEETKSGFEEYAINSMSQTRSIGKAYRNLLAFVMTSAGYEPTPAEEMEEVKFQQANVVAEKKKDLRKVPTSDQFKGIINKFTTGETTMEEIEYHFKLTDDQYKALKKLSV